MNYDHEVGGFPYSFEEGDAQRKLKESKERGLEPTVHLGSYVLNGSEVKLQLNRRGRNSHLFDILSPVTTNAEGLSLPNALLRGFKKAMPDETKLKEVSHAFELPLSQNDVTALQFRVNRPVVNEEGEEINHPYSLTSVVKGERYEERVAQAVLQTVQALTLSSTRS